MKDIGDTLRKRRIELELTQQEVADLAEVGINTLVAIERGSGNPSVKTLNRVCQVLGYSIIIGMK